MPIWYYFYAELLMFKFHIPKCVQVYLYELCAVDLYVYKVILFYDSAAITIFSICVWISVLPNKLIWIQEVYDKCLGNI